MILKVAPKITPCCHLDVEVDDTGVSFCLMCVEEAGYRLLQVVQDDGCVQIA